MILGLVYSDYNEVSIIFSDMEFLPAFFLSWSASFRSVSFGHFGKTFCFRFGIPHFMDHFGAGCFGLLGWKVMSWEAAKAVKRFFPLESMSNLIKEPFTRLSAVQNIGQQIGEDMKFDYHVYWHEFLIVIIWTAIFIYLSYALLKKRDL